MPLNPPGHEAAPKSGPPTTSSPPKPNARPGGWRSITNMKGSASGGANTGSRKMSLSTVINLQLVIFAVWIVFQVIQLESSMLRHSNHDANGHPDGHAASTSQDPHHVGNPTYIQTSRQFQNNDRNDASAHSISDGNANALPYTHETYLHRSHKAGFGACLILMDDNHYLSEWLAYHHLTLPLRRLIVAIDPRSQTDPTEILKRYQRNGLMNITIWHEEDIMPPEALFMHTTIGELNHNDLEILYIERQRFFNTRCMSWMRHEGYSWVAMTDVDEFVDINPYASKQFKLTPPPTRNYTILDIIQRNRFSNAMFRRGCISMHRLQMGTTESAPAQVQKLVPSGFNGSDFQTLRFRYHSGIKNKQYNKIAKCLVDVRSVPGHWIQHDENDAHRPIKSICKDANKRIESAMAPLMAYHYAGTWEAWNFRVDFREKRKREVYDQLAFNKSQNQIDHIRPWLREFVDTMGYHLAAELLKGAGQVPPKPNVTWMPGGFENTTL